ncbi:MAG: uncharacterized protein K0S54_1683 [Alphaproteobacteria bacterium]|nr:uncharacterized protein [Alphaproteobacteria bacterium]
MIRKTTKWLLRITAGVVAGLAVLLALGFWRLLQGPVPLDFALPYLEDSIAATDGSVRFEAREVTLNWAGWDRTLEIRVGALEARGANGETLATVPQAAVNLSLLALLKGEIAPTVIQLEKLRLNVVLAEDGRIDFGRPGEQEAGGRFLSLLIDQLLTRDEQIPLISRLERVVVTGAEIVFEDRKKSLRWHAPNAELVLARDDKGVLGEAAIEIEAQNQRATLNVRALFSRDDRSFAVSMNFDGIRPSLLASLDPTLLEPLAQVDLAFGGTVDARVSARGKIESLTVNIGSGPGTIGTLGMFQEPRTVRGTALRGEVSIEQGTLRIDSLALDFGEAKVDMKAEGAIAGGNVSFAATIDADRVATQDLAKFWPPGMSPGGRTWTLLNIEGGQAKDLRLKFDFTGDLNQPETIRLSNIAGSMEFTDLAVHYLRPMPPVRGVGGTMTMNESSIRFDVKTGALGDIALNNAAITLSNLDQPANHRAHIDVTSTGPLAAKLRLLEHPKVGMPREMAVRPERVSGQASTRVLIDLPLIDSLTMAQVEYAASATTAGVGIKDVAVGIDLSDAALTLQLNGREMDIRGKAKIAGQIADLTWRVNFGRAALRSRYEVKTTIEASELARLAGVELTQIKGPVGVQAILSETIPGTGSANAVLDFKQAVIQVPEIGWRKEAGREAGGRVSFDLRGSKPGNRIEVELAASDLQAQAAVFLAADGNVQRTEFNRLVFGRNNLRANISRTSDGYSVALAGNSFDLAPFLDEPALTAEPAAAEPPPPLRGPIYDIALDLRQVLTKRGKLDGVTGKARLQGGRVLSADMTGRVGQATLVRTQIAPTEKGRRLTIDTADIGAVLKSLGWLEGMFGGDMHLAGEFDDSRAGSPLRGSLRIGEYKLIKTPVVGDVLSVAPLTDALSAFSGSGLAFDRLQASFGWHKGVLTLNNARTAGTSLGLTASGRINTNNETVQVEGVIVPAYVLNSLIGNIPLIGPLITGGQGGGIFAINYAVEGPVAKPTVSVNPLSALAPGFLRNLFGAGSGEDPTVETPTTAPPPAPQPAPSQPMPLLAPRQ